MGWLWVWLGSARVGLGLVGFGLGLAWVLGFRVQRSSAHMFLSIYAPGPDLEAFVSDPEKNRVWDLSGGRAVPSPLLFSSLFFSRLFCSVQFYSIVVFSLVSSSIVLSAIILCSLLAHSLLFSSLLFSYLLLSFYSLQHIRMGDLTSGARGPSAYKKQKNGNNPGHQENINQ